jgi:hypothetical protein
MVRDFEASDRSTGDAIEGSNGRSIAACQLSMIVLAQRQAHACRRVEISALAGTNAMSGT